MFVKDMRECNSFVAGDATVLRELLHPAKDDVAVQFSVAHATLRTGETSLPHRLCTAELYYVLSGTGTMHINDEQCSVRQGQIVYIPPGARQWIRNTGTMDLTFLCIVEPAWRSEDEEIL